MTLEAEDRNLLIRYRIEQSDQTVLEAEYLIAAGFYRGAINRIYYSCFYISSALAIKYEFQTSKHSQLIGYEPVDDLDKEEVLILLEDLKGFVSKMKAFITKTS